MVSGVTVVKRSAVCELVSMCLMVIFLSSTVNLTVSETHIMMSYVNVFCSFVCNILFYLCIGSLPSSAPLTNVNPNSDKSCIVHIISYTAADIAMCSASADESATVG